MLTPSVALRCQALVKRFADKTAVDHLDLTVPTGAIFGLLGPNGSGKTSIIRTALGIYVPDDGSVELLGSRDPMAVRHRVGYLPEERGLYAKMKVVEQLAFLASIRGLDRKDRDPSGGSLARTRRACGQRPVPDWRAVEGDAAEGPVRLGGDS